MIISMDDTSKDNCEIILQPIGRRIQVSKGITILDAAREAGVELVSICGGDGVCGTCKVRIINGDLSQLTLNEEGELTQDEIKNGFRLACQAEVMNDTKVDIPPESFTTPQRLQVEGFELKMDLDPPVIPLEVIIPEPSLQDLRSDSTRLKDYLKDHEDIIIFFGLPISKELPGRIRQNSREMRIAIRIDEIISILGTGKTLFGFAVDIGTTKLAAYLVNMETGETVAKTGAMNPQIAYGEDVISRITYANHHTNGAKVLQDRLVETLNGLLADLCHEIGIEQNQVVEGVLVGNTAMHHLFTGLPVKQLGESPYVAAFGEALEFNSSELGLNMADGAYVYMPPNIAGYVGADHIAMLIGCDLFETSKTIVALDIGTNTEISLFHKRNHYSCSCASGPAFEGAHIQDGMRAANGSIERVRIEGNDIQIQTIGNEPAVGICGSGILDTLAEMKRIMVLDKRGVIKGSHSAIKDGENGKEFQLVSAKETGIGRDIRITRQDINEIQLAKAAIRTGVEVLLIEAGITSDAIEEFIVAGAFGTYLDVSSAIQIGMFPNIPRERFQQVGNAAGIGARKLLLSNRQRKIADKISQNINYVELATHPFFMKTYIKSLSFE